MKRSSHFRRLYTLLFACATVLTLSATAAPTYEQWVADGKKIPKDRVFIGGSPWFNESTGKNRTPQEVYKMLYGAENAKPAPAPKNAKKPPAQKAYPTHWGEPPRRQTRDLRPLPGGYGRGSSTLAKWIKTNMDLDKKDPTRGETPKEPAPKK